MRLVKVFEHISLDGVIAPGGRSEGAAYEDGDWTAPFRTPGGGAAVADAQGTGFDLLLGRRTYDLWSEYWPKASGGPFADAFNTATKFVATHRPESLTWGPCQDLGTDIIESVRRLKTMAGPDLVTWGSGTLTSALFDAGLIDEVVLAVYPVLLGEGKRFFSERCARRELAWVSTKTSSSGVLLNTYRHLGPLRTA